MIMDVITQDGSELSYYAVPGLRQEGTSMKGRACAGTQRQPLHWGRQLQTGPSVGH